ncbi:hypothetical protein ES705_44589 [subsurface metagenome]
MHHLLSQLLADLLTVPVLEIQTPPSAVLSRLNQSSSADSGHNTPLNIRNWRVHIAKD